MADFTVVYDSCVLYPAPLRDLLVQLATVGLFKARWTNEIHEEWINSLLNDRPDLLRERLERTKDLINRSVLDCLVEGYESLIPTLNLPDPDDRHVLAAAIRCSADAIVTFNLQDFPEQVLNLYDIEAQHPDDFIVSQFDLSATKVCAAAEEIWSRLKNPPKTRAEYLDVLLRQQLPQTVAILKEMWYRPE